MMADVDLQCFRDPSGILPGAKSQHEVVEDRLIEAMGVLLRSSDREMAWLHVTSMSLWQQVKSDMTEAAADDRPLVTCALTRAEVERAEEAMAWVSRVVPSGDTRRILGLALTRLVTRGKDRAIWPWVFQMMGGKASGWTTDGLRMRYSRSITSICRLIYPARSAI